MGQDDRTSRYDEGVRTTGIDLKIRHQHGVTHKSNHCTEKNIKMPMPTSDSENGA